MSGVRIEGDFRRLRHALSRLKNFNYSALNKDIGQEIRTQTKDRFKKEVDPEDNPWKISIRVKEHGGKILSNNADLKNSIKVKVNEDGVAVGTNKVYAAIHQYGGSIRKKGTKKLIFRILGRNQIRDKIEMPKRAYLGINDENMTDINEILQDHIREHIE